MSSAIAIASLAALAIQAAAVPTIPLAPSGPWNVEYADKMCLLTRDFGTGVAKVTLGLRPAPGGDDIRVVVMNRDASAKVVRGEAKLSIDGKAPVTAPFVSAGVKGQATRISALDVKRSDITPLETAKQLQLQAGTVDIRLAPSRVADALKVLGHCENDLLVEWGMDPAVLASIVQFPRVAGEGGALRHFSPDDYPSEAMRQEEQGTAGARIHVAADGRVTECVVFEPSGSKTLDDQTCRIISARVRYEPALGKDGKAVASFSFLRIRWALPN
jgi:TonB family protein